MTVNVTLHVLGPNPQFLVCVAYTLYLAQQDLVACAIDCAFNHGRADTTLIDVNIRPKGSALEAGP